MAKWSRPSTRTGVWVSLDRQDPAQLPSTLVLVLDDYHQIENPDIHESLVYLIEHFPLTLRLTICTRSGPPMPFSRWRVPGYLSEIRGDDLRFNQQEIEDFARGFADGVIDKRLSTASSKTANRKFRVRQS